MDMDNNIGIGLGWGEAGGWVDIGKGIKSRNRCNSISNKIKLKKLKCC